MASSPDGVVLVRDITFAGLSEATLLPFHGRCHIAYVPRDGVILGLSKLARATKCLAARVQSQGQFAHSVLAAVECEVAPRGVAVVVQASHLGLGTPPLQQLTSAACGCFRDPSTGLLAEFLALLRLGSLAPGDLALAASATAGGDEQQQQQQYEQQQCQQQQQLLALRGGGGGHAASCTGFDAGCGGAAAAAGSRDMVAAVATLLEGVGEDPSRPVLAAACQRYVCWLHGATAGYSMQLPSAADVGPPTPDEHSPDPSDASSDDMSADGATSADAASADGREWCGACGSGRPLSPLEGCRLGREAGREEGGEGEEGQVASSSSSIVTFSTQFASQCEHHLLPFYGTLQLAYEPGSSGGSSGSSNSCNGSSGGAAAAAQLLTRSQAAAALQHIVEMYSRRMQVGRAAHCRVAHVACGRAGERLLHSGGWVRVVSLCLPVAYLWPPARWH